MLSDYINPMEEYEKIINSLRRKTYFMSRILECMKEGVVILNSEGCIEGVNKAFHEITGLSYERLIRNRLENIDLKWEGLPTFKEVWEIVNNQGLWVGEVVGIHPNGYMYTCDAILSKVVAGGETVGYIFVVQDITEKRSLESNLRSLSYYDLLTGLPNRALLYNHLNQMLYNAKIKNEKVAVLFIDIDNFKIVNESMGHEIGDRLLKLFAERLASSVNSDSMVARFGSDEFVMVKGGLKDIDSIKLIAESIIEKISQPFFVENKKLYITVTIGISVFPIDGVDPDILLKNADMAMHHAKEIGRNTYQFYTSELNMKVSERFYIEGKLREAIGKNELYLHYQPQFNLEDDKLVGFEALLRWYNPESGLLLPGKFITVAEESDLIESLGEWVIRQACSHGKILEDMGYKLKIAVNISSNQLSSPDFDKKVEYILTETGFSPDLLEFEITESTLIKNKKEAMRVLNRLKSMGITIAVDDFGTSYSSLNYLKYFPVDKLKIDRSFIGDIISDPNDVAITTTIIAIAHNLGLKATAEGVETEEQLTFLKLWQCDEAQGYFFSPPLPFKDVVDRLKNNLLPVKGE